MTEDLRARTSRSPRPVGATSVAPSPRAVARTKSNGAALAIGGALGLAGFLTLAVAMSGASAPSGRHVAPSSTPVHVAATLAKPSSHRGAVAAAHMRVVSPATVAPAGAKASDPAGVVGARVRPNRSASAPSMSQSAILAAARTTPAASHRFSPPTIGGSAAFMPVAMAPAAPDAVMASTAAAKAEPVTLVASLTPAAVVHPAAAPGKSSAARPAPPEDHVETALPDNGAEPVEATAPPVNARDALERELALAIPTPTTRPFRKPSAEPVLGKRHRAPAGLLAYARPDAGDIGDEPSVLDRPSPAKPRLGAGTAIYDIAAATVYLPNGERLEAHSGLGRMRDDVRFVREKNRGPTPPHTYNLAMRESLFHGVAAIRLHPVGGQGRIHDRNGLLAHTYMLGPRGDSNGCVSFKDYKRFLAAFKRGEIKRLVVVASLDSPPSRIASWFDRIKP